MTGPAREERDELTRRLERAAAREGVTAGNLLHTVAEIERACHADERTTRLQVALSDAARLLETGGQYPRAAPPSAPSGTDDDTRTLDARFISDLLDALAEATTADEAWPILTSAGFYSARQKAARLAALARTPVSADAPHIIMQKCCEVLATYLTLDGAEGFARELIDATAPQAAPPAAVAPAERERAPTGAPEPLAALLREARDFVASVHDWHAHRHIRKDELPFNVCDYATMGDLMHRLTEAAARASAPERGNP